MGIEKAFYYVRNAKKRQGEKDSATGQEKNVSRSGASQISGKILFFFRQQWSAILRRKFPRISLQL